MSIEINGKVYRNLQEQVEKNKEDIEHLAKYTDLYTTHCLKISGSSADVQAQTTAVWTLTAYHKMPIDEVEDWPHWIQEALDTGAYSIDSMLFYEQDDLTPLTQFSYSTSTEEVQQIDCRGIIIGTSDAEECNRYAPQTHHTPSWNSKICNPHRKGPYIFPIPI